MTQRRRRLRSLHHGGFGLSLAERREFAERVAGSGDDGQHFGGRQAERQERGEQPAEEGQAARLAADEPRFFLQYCHSLETYVLPRRLCFRLPQIPGKSPKVSSFFSPTPPNELPAMLG